MGRFFGKVDLLYAALRGLEYYRYKDLKIDTLSTVTLLALYIVLIKLLFIYLIVKNNCWFLPLSGVFFNDTMSVAIAFRTNDISDMRYLHKKRHINTFRH